MNRNAKFLLIVSLVTAVLVVGLASVYLGWSGEQRTKVSVALIENLTINFSDRASLYLVRDNMSLLSSTVSALLFSNVILYVQVVQDGDVILDERLGLGTNLDLSLITPAGSIQSDLQQLSDGASYLDVVKTLFPLESADQQRISGYVRIGRSLNELSAEIQSERLVVTGIGLAIWGVLFLGAWLTLRWFNQPKLVAPTVETEQLIKEKAPSIQSSPSEPVETVISDLTEEISSDPKFQSEPEPAVVTTEASTDLRKIGELALDDVRKYVEVRGEAIELSPKEFDLLKLLCEEPGKVYSNDEILKNIWAEHSFASAQDVKQYIYFLRRKLEENPKKPQVIVTVRGFGYKVEAVTGNDDEV